MFDFLKDGSHEKKYKSTNQIPFLFSGEDLFSQNNANEAVETHTPEQESKADVFTPFFAIEEDQEMEDEVSNSDGFMSDAGQESNDSEAFQSKGRLKFHLSLPWY